MRPAAWPADCSKTVADPASDLEVLNALGWLHWSRYLASPADPDDADISAAVKFFEPVYRADPDAVPKQVRNTFDATLPGALQQGAALLQQANGTGDLATLNKAIDLLEQAADVTIKDRPDRATALSVLQLALFSRFERTGDPQDLDRAIDLGEKALDAAPGEAATQARLSNALGAALMCGIKNRSLSDLSRAIDLDEKALDTSSDDDPQWPIYLSALGVCARNPVRAIRAAGRPGGRH